MDDDDKIGLGDAGVINETWEESYDADPGTATVAIEPDGSIILDANAIALYRIFVGDADRNDVGDLDALSYDELPVEDLNDPPSPIWWALEAFIPFQWPQPLNSDLTAGGDEESFGETTIGQNNIATRLDFPPNQVPIDTQVNVDLFKLGPGNFLWLEYQVVGGASEFVPIVEGVPEPGTALLLLVGVCGLLLWRRRPS